MSSTAAAAPDYPSSVPPSLLLLILDIHPLSWSLLAETPPPPREDDPEIVGAALNKTHPTALTINEFLNVLIVFLNSHLAAAWGNDVVVYGATAGRS
jgi:transcription initiation factor TFIIH subunit 3